MKQQLRLLMLTLLCAVCSATWAETVTDVLNLAFTGVEDGAGYTNWSEKRGVAAIYAGNSAGGNGSIQLRSNNNNSGIVTTVSNSKVKKITVVWHENTVSGRTLNVYGKNTAYSAATDLYNSTDQGTLLGTIVCGTSTVLEITGDYKYIGLRSNSSAMYLTSVSIDWEPSSAVNTPTITDGGNFLQQQEVTITAEEGCTIHYTINGEDPTADNWITPKNNPFSFFVAETTTVKAIAEKDGKFSDVAEATFTKVDLEISINPSDIQVSGQGGKGTLEISSNLDLEKMSSVNYSIVYYDPESGDNLGETPPSWFSISPSDDFKTFTYNVTPNESEEGRKALFKIFFAVVEVESWPAANIESDGINVTQNPMSDVLFYESFNQCDGKGGNDGLWSGQIASNTLEADNKWTFVNGSGANQCAKFTTGSAAGSATSPKLEYEGDAKLTFKAGAWGTDGTILTVTITGGAQPESQEFQLKNSQFDDYSLDITGFTKESTITFSSPKGKRFFLDEVIIEKVVSPVTSVTATFKPKFMGFTSIYYSDKNLIVPENVTAHTYVVENGKGRSNKDYAAGAIIPKGTGVILEYGGDLKDIPEEGLTVAFEETKDEGEADPDNMLRGFDTAQTTTVDEGEDPNDYYFYRYTVGLGDKSTTIGFYFADASGSPFTAGAHKIYLAVPKSQFTDNLNASYISEDTDGINDIISVSSQETIYTLSGVKVSRGNLPKGIYIVNGKKMVIK